MATLSNNENSLKYFKVVKTAKSYSRVGSREEVYLNKSWMLYTKLVWNIKETGLKSGVDLI